MERTIHPAVRWTAVSALGMVAVLVLAACSAGGRPGEAVGDTSGAPATPPVVATPAAPAQSSDSWTPALLDRAYAVVHDLGAHDFTHLAGLVHPDRGVTFSPYAFVEPDAVTFSAAKLKTLALGDTFVWGAYDGSGDPIDLSVADYFDKFVLNQDFSQAPLIGIDHLVQTGNTLINLSDAFPGAHFVEFNFPGSDPAYDGMDWASLRLVFEQVDGAWMLVGVVGDRWTV